MPGIYTVTTGTWSDGGEFIPDDMDMYTNQGPPTIDGKQVTVGDRIDIPVIRGGEYLPPPGTIIFLMECPYLPDGLYKVIATYSMPNDDYEPGIEVPRMDGVGLVPL
jgi:hypothetical protein